MVYHIFCDESRQCSHRFMVLGGIIIPAGNIDRFNETMKQYRQEQNMHAELKWSKISNQKINEYKKFVEYFFALNNTDNIHFHSIIIDTHQLNHRKYNDGSKEIGFYKFYYQLLLHCFAVNYVLDETSRFIVYLDNRSTNYSLSDLRDILNNGIKKKLGVSHNAVASIQPVDSKKSEVMQINDIVLGAIGFQKNGYHLLSGYKQSKIDIAKYIAEQAGLMNLQNNSPFGKVRFKIWNFRLRK